MSPDGSAARVVGSLDSSGGGGARAFTRSNGVSTPQGSELVGTEAGYVADQERSVATSADGNAASVSGQVGYPGAPYPRPGIAPGSFAVLVVER
ncbi:MAG TPA: hypothetical protein VMT19_02680 [Thermoanaerobaculaceae bacterium]|nr:hypothetical protein [Thermoanaerobaculaceae bacterium]